MKLLLCVVAFALGMASGATIRYGAVVQAAYHKGYTAGLHTCHSEAVKEGHAEWKFSRPGDLTERPAFSWYPTRDWHYQSPAGRGTPDSRE